MKEKESSEVRERIEKMIKEAKSVVDEARATARDLKRKARREMREERRRIHIEERKKDKILNLRIGEDLEQKLRSESDRLRVPVSALVRNILDNAFDLVDDITRNVEELVEDVVQDAGGVKDTFRSAVKDVVEDATGVKDTFRTAVKDVLGACDGVSNGASNMDVENIIENVSIWKEVTLGKPTDCIGCNETIPRWNKAHGGEREKGGDMIFLCGPCMEKMRK